jgi:hypothetical protein
MLFLDVAIEDVFPVATKEIYEYVDAKYFNIVLVNPIK